MTLLIAGSRTINDYEFVQNKLKNLVHKTVEVVSGGATGADALGKKWATQNNIKHTEMRADWDIHGKSAGHRRNKRMAEYLKIKENPLVVVFWDGSSPGSKNMIENALSLKLNTMVIFYESPKSNDDSH